ncbi:924_t:CDS:2, partial [Entrophospora sp. SA101]
MNTASKIRKPQTNNFTSILDQILKKYNLSTESNPSQLHVYASELGAMLPDWKAHQIKALVPDKRNEKLTIKERAQYCAKSGDPYDIWLHALDLIKTKNDSDEEIVASSSRLTLFRKELKEAGVDSKVIDIYAKFSALTQDSNEIQKKQLQKCDPIQLGIKKTYKAIISGLIDIGKFFLGYSSWIAERAVIKNISKPRCKDFRAFNDNLCAVHLGKEKVLLNKPIYVGSAVLDL